MDIYTFLPCASLHSTPSVGVNLLIRIKVISLVFLLLFVHVCACKGQRTTSRIVGIELRSSGLHSTHIYLQSRLSGLSVC